MTIKNGIYPKRIAALRKKIIGDFPIVPNSADSRAAMHLLSTNELITAFLTWRERLIPKKPREVKLWSEGVTSAKFETIKQGLRLLLDKVAAGEDLTSHLSTSALRAGLVLPNARSEERGKDIDSVLTRYGLHHFHVGIQTPENKKGRSGILIFAHVLEDEFRVVAIAHHNALRSDFAEHLDFSKTCNAYISRNLQPGEGFMLNPVTPSGHSIFVTMFGIKCDDEMQRLDPLLDDIDFSKNLYEKNAVFRDGRRIERPKKTSLTWHFEDMEFGILDTKNKVFFCIFPYFAR